MSTDINDLATTDDKAEAGITDTPETAEAEIAETAGAGTAEALAVPPVPAPKGRQISFTITGRGVRRFLVAVVALAVIAYAIAASVFWYRDHSKLTAASAAKSASEHFTTELLSTLNAENADQYTARISPLATGALKASLEKQRADTQQNVRDMDLKTTASIWSSSVQNVNSQHANTVVIAEVTGTSKTAVSTTTNVLVFRLSLDNVGGKWLVSNFEGLPGTNQTGVASTDAGTGGQPAEDAPAPAQAPAPSPVPAG